MADEPATIYATLDLSRRFDREVLRGFLTVAKASGWHVWVSEWMQVTDAQARSVDGWLFRSTSHPLFAEPAIRRRGVLVSGEAGGEALRVWGDDRAQGMLAAEALADKGYRHVAFRSDRRYRAFQDRAAGFTDRARERGLTVHAFDASELLGRWSWMAERDHTRRMLGRLPRPIGIGVLDTLTAMRLAEHCRKAGWRIGPEVGIISTEHDELAAGTSLPSIAGIDVGADALGIQAAEMLRRRLRGLPEEESVAVVAPRGLVGGDSILLQGASGGGLAAALAVIRERAGALTAGELAEQMGTTLRSLERLFEQGLQRGPAAEIRRERVARAAELLRDSELPLATIAGRCGFGSTTTLGRAFKAEWGLTPQAWRRRVRQVGRPADQHRTDPGGEGDAAARA